MSGELYALATGFGLCTGALTVLSLEMTDRILQVRTSAAARLLAFGVGFASMFFPIVAVAWRA